MARTIRKMQVPAYAPVEVGVQAVVYKGVSWAVVKTIDMELMPDMDVPVEAAAEVALVMAITMVDDDDDICDMSIVAIVVVMDASVFDRASCRSLQGTKEILPKSRLWRPDSRWSMAHEQQMTLSVD
jgi:hypothetical protein